MSRKISFKNIAKSYLRPNATRPDAVLDNFSFDIEPGTLVAFVGPSGVGKSTLLHLVANLDVPDRGSIQWSEARDGADRLAVAFQQPRLLNWLTVRENIEIVLRDRVDPAFIDDTLEAVGLQDYADAYPLALSGGQRQRAALARAFAVNPGVLLLDEPFSALDELTARRLRLTLQDLWIARAPTGILVTHNMQEAAFLADRVVILKGRPAQIVKIIDVDLPKPRVPEDPAVFQVYREIMANLA